MAATLLARVPLDQITAEAKQVRFSRVALTLLAGVLFAAGWLVAKAVRFVARALAVAWFASAWCVTAFRVGYQEGRKPRTVPAG